MQTNAYHFYLCSHERRTNYAFLWHKSLYIVENGFACACLLDGVGFGGLEVVQWMYTLLFASLLRYFLFRFLFGLWIEWFDITNAYSTVGITARFSCDMYFWLAIFFFKVGLLNRKSEWQNERQKKKSCHGMGWNPID